MKQIQPNGSTLLNIVTSTSFQHKNKIISSALLPQLPPQYYILRSYHQTKHHQLLLLQQSENN